MNDHSCGKLAEFAAVVGPGDCLRAARCEGKGSVLVLGDDALALLDPREVRRRCRPPSCILLAAPRFAAYATAARWREEAGAELVEPEDLEARVGQAASWPLRRFLPLDSWAPVPERLDPIAMQVLHAVPLLEDLRPAGLARALGMKPRLLRRACGTRFGMSPLRLLWRYKREYVAWRRAEGAGMAGVAIELGYANKSNLLHALRAKRVGRPS